MMHMQSIRKLDFATKIHGFLKLTFLIVQERDKKGGDLLASSTIDVMAQSGILNFFLTRRARGEPIQINDKLL